MTEEEYIKTRVDDQIMWYSKKAKKNKLFHHWTRSAVIVVSSAIPVISGLEFDNSNKDSMLGLLGTLIAIVSGVSGLLKFQEKWSEYRSTSESLIHEKMLYFTKTGPFDNAEEPFKILVNRVEGIINNENIAWNQYINKENI